MSKASYLWVACLLTGMSCRFSSVVLAGEPFQAFLEGLRNRQMFDMARVYLEQSKTNPLVSEQDRQRIALEEGRLAIAEASATRDSAERVRLLDQGQRKLQAIIKANPNDPVAAEATTSLGTVLIDRGRITLNQWRHSRAGTNREKLQAEARQQFSHAEEIFKDAEAKAAQVLSTFPKVIDEKNRQQKAALQAARTNLLHAELSSANVLEDQSKLLDPKSAEFKKSLQAAADKYGQIYKDYPTYKGGVSARISQGRCLLELGNIGDALTYEEEVIAICNAAIQDKPIQKPELKPLISKALAVELECWLRDKDKNYAKASELGRAWIDSATPGEEQSPEGAAILWLTAQALKSEADTLKDDKKKQSANIRDAARFAGQAARIAGEHQEQARELAAQLRRAAAENEPTTFADAYTAGKSAIDEVSQLSQSIKDIQAGEGDRAKLPELEKNKNTAIENAQRNFERAMSLQAEDTPKDQLNEVRYLQAYLSYVTGRSYDAVVVGEFVARKYPDSPFARQSAQIALAAALQAYNAQPQENREFELARMARIAEYTASRWPDQPEAAQSWMLLGDVALRSGNVAAATEYFAKIPADSPVRAEADLKQGQALWARYSDAVAATADGKKSNPDAEKLLPQAQQLLEHGIEQLRQLGEEPGFGQLLAELSLAQLYNMTGHCDRALAILNRPETGPMALVARNAEVTRRANYGAEVLKCALRAYVGAQQLDRAEQIMQQLDKKYASEANGAATLTALYVSLGRELEGQLKQLQAEGSADQVKQVLEGFQKFLEHIAKRESNPPSTLNWIGETYYRLGSGLDGQKVRSDQAVAYFGKSAATYAKLLKMAQSDPKLAANVTALRLKLCRSLRGEGQFQQAMDQLSEILRANPKVLDLQIEAATTYQQWAQRDPKYYHQAINGSDGQGGGLIWGWNGLRRRLQQSPKYKENYEQARFNVAECSYRAALTKTGDDKKEGLHFVERLVTSYLRLDPQLGGPEWRAKYDALLKQVQTAAGRQPEGLSALAPPETASNRKSPAG